MNTIVAIIISFTKIGIISLGGGGSMLNLLQYETVNYRHWVSHEEFISMLGTSYFFPGLTGIKLAALIGYKAAGVWGLILALTCLNLPGLLLALFAYLWLGTNNSPVMKKIMVGVQYGALALLAAATYSIGESIVGIYYSIPIVMACLLFFFALTFLQLSPFWGFAAFISVCYFLQ